jgi:hypothetical protein
MLRIQHKNNGATCDNARTIIKQGIYSGWYEANRQAFPGSTFERNDMLRKFLYGPKHPNMRDDAPLFNEAKRQGIVGAWDEAPGYVFGFIDKAQMREWFYDDEFLVAAHDAGFEVVYFSGEIIKGEKQAIMKAATAKIIRRKSLLDFTCFPSPI